MEMAYSWYASRNFRISTGIILFSALTGRARIFARFSRIACTWAEYPTSITTSLEGGGRAVRTASGSVPVKKHRQIINNDHTIGRDMQTGRILTDIRTLTRGDVNDT